MFSELIKQKLTVPRLTMQQNYHLAADVDAVDVGVGAVEVVRLQAKQLLRSKNKISLLTFSRKKNKSWQIFGTSYAASSKFNRFDQQTKAVSNI